MSVVDIIVLAAGSGTRFGDTKQFRELSPGVRLIDAAVGTASSLPGRIILVLPPGFEWDGREVDATVVGGSSRVDSVARGLTALSDESEVVVVHDAAHPLAPRKVFEEVIKAVLKGADAAVPMLPLGDVVKRRDQRGQLVTLGRDGLGLAQVPMAFSTDALVAAHSARPSRDGPVWDDSVLVELNEGRVVAVEGSSKNIHVVTPDDLSIARALVAAEPLDRP